MDNLLAFQERDWVQGDVWGEQNDPEVARDPPNELRDGRLQERRRTPAALMTRRPMAEPVWR
jgi:hypothetical protein